MFGGAARCFDGGAACAVELWPGFCGGVAARGAWRVGGYGWCGSAATVARWGYGWCGSAELLRYTGERGIMGAAAHPNTKNPTGRRGSFYSFLLKYKVRTCSQR